MNNKTQVRDDQIITMYKSGSTYKEITNTLGANATRISKLVKGIRGPRGASKLTMENGRHKLPTAEQCSKGAQKACIASKKFWTKPEQEFRKLLKECGIGVKFPDGIKSIINELDDENAEIYYQYPIQRYLCDFVDVKNSIIFRINGDYWHANPILYKDNELSKPQQHNKKQDKNAKIFFEKNKWTVIDIWESELKWNIHHVREKVISCRITQDHNHQIDHRFNSTDSNAWENRLHDLWFKKTKKQKVGTERKCHCGNHFHVTTKRDIDRKRCCSEKCQRVSSRKVVRPSVDELKLELAESSAKAMSKKYGVSDKAIAKWLKRQ